MFSFFQMSTGFIAVAILLSLCSSSYSADYYKWTDENGNLHFSDSSQNIPEKYRNQIKKKGHIDNAPSPTEPLVKANQAKSPSGYEESAEYPKQTIAKEEVFYSQPALLEQKLSELKPGRKGVVDLYFVGFGGSSSEDVFMKEIKVISKLFDERFDTRGRSIALINNAQTVGTVPIATRTALEMTVKKIAMLMNKDEDVLFLYLTSHGSKKHDLSVDFLPLQLNEIYPADIKKILNNAGITWSVVVISACYSGGYIEPLKNENTMIITSTDANSRSFGCSNDSNFTYFGKAYFYDALRKSYSFIQPFDEAKKAILKRERDQSEEPSNPQIYVGAAIRKQLEKLEKRLQKIGSGA